jgi:hypothetical protein
LLRQPPCLLCCTRKPDCHFGVRRSDVRVSRGEAGPSLQEFGIGTLGESSSLADRNMVFVVDYRLPPVLVPIVNKGYF